MAPQNLAVLALFSNLFALIHRLKSNFLLLFGKNGGEGRKGEEEEGIKPKGMGGGGSFGKSS